MAAAQARSLLRGVQAEGGSRESPRCTGEETQRENLPLVRKEFHAIARRCAVLLERLPTTRISDVTLARLASRVPVPAVAVAVALAVLGRPAGAQAAQGAIAYKHLTSKCLAATRGGSGRQTGNTSSHAGLCGTQVADAARHKPLGCDGPVVTVQKRCIIFLVSSNERGISYAESKDAMPAHQTL